MDEDEHTDGSTDDRSGKSDERPDDPAGAASPAIGEASAADLENLVTLVGHFYRGQLDRETTWRSRLDRTTNWAVVVVATLLTWTFSAADNPHYVLLIGGVLIVLFLGLEAHRYRAYDVPRSRVRMLEENVFGPMFDPARDAEHEQWRRRLSEDLRRPSPTVSTHTAVGRRLRRVYLPLLTVVFAAWIAKLTLFQPGMDWVAAAALPPIPGRVVVAVVALSYAVALVAAWPTGEGGRREVEGETRDAK